VGLENVSYIQHQLVALASGQKCCVGHAQLQHSHYIWGKETMIWTGVKSYSSQFSYCEQRFSFFKNKTIDMLKRRLSTTTTMDCGLPFIHYWIIIIILSSLWFIRQKMVKLYFLMLTRRGVVGCYSAHTTISSILRSPALPLFWWGKTHVNINYVTWTQKNHTWTFPNEGSCSLREGWCTHCIIFTANICMPLPWRIVSYWLLSAKLLQFLWSYIRCIFG